MDDAAAKQRLAELKAAAPVKHKRQPFVKVPMALAARAACATGSQRMMVWLYVLHRCWQRQAPSIVLSNSALMAYGISREVKRQALKDLAAAGLIVVDYRPNKNPIVTPLGVNG